MTSGGMEGSEGRMSAEPPGTSAISGTTPRGLAPGLFAACLVALAALSLLSRAGPGSWVLNFVQPTLTLLAVGALALQTGSNRRLLLAIAAAGLLLVGQVLVRRAFGELVAVRLLGDVLGATLLAGLWITRAAPWGRCGWKPFACAAALGAAPAVAAFGLATVAGASWAAAAQWQSHGPGAAVMLAVAALPLNTARLGLGEELVFRGLLLEWRLRVPAARVHREIWLNGLLFGLWHIPVDVWAFRFDTANLVVNLLMQALSGVLFAALYVASGRRLLPAAVAHALQDWLVQDMVSARGVLQPTMQGAAGGLFGLGFLVGAVGVAFAAVRLAAAPAQPRAARPAPDR